MSDDDFENPYLREVRDYVIEAPRLSEEATNRQVEITQEYSSDWVQKRWEAIEEYAFAIPSRKTIEILVEHDPLIEIGAGTGYWAHLIEQLGGDIIVVDNFSSGDDAKVTYSPEDTWTEVREGDETVVSEYPDRTLFLCWPHFESNFATEALKLYEGETVIYVGEWRPEYADDDEFFDILDRDFDLIDRVSLPCWMGTKDTMMIQTRSNEE